MLICNKNNGYVYSKIIKENNIPTIYLTRLVKEGKLKKISRGIYISNETIEDFYFINSIKYSKIVYSGDTALFLNGLSNKQVVKNEATISFGSTTPKIKNMKIITSRKITFSLGIEEISTPFGNKVKCYNKERCICDLFLHIDKYDYEDRVYSINEYKNNYLNLKKLYEYAKKLKIYDEVKNVFEVIGWN